jgi:RNA polymerase sigma-70 factor (ECF subfamily)
MHFAAGQFDELLRDAREGSSAALGQLLEPYQGDLAMHPVVRGMQRHIDAAEVVQESFQSAIRGFSQFRGQTEAEWRAWLLRIARNQAVNLVQRQRNTQKRGPAVSLDRVGCQAALYDLLIDDEATP